MAMRREQIAAALKYLGDKANLRRQAEPYLLEPGAAGMIESGNIDLSYRPQVRNTLPDEGGYSTIRSLGFQDKDGNEVLVPTVINGKIVSDDEAIKHYYQSGQFLGKFKTPEASTAFAKRLHEVEEKYRMPSGQVMRGKSK
jgi:hypothetical protein